MASADGKGRTILEILTGKSKRKMTQLELQYNNPLEAKVGQVIGFEHEAELKGIRFVIDQIAVYETKVDGRKAYHTDYCLKGIDTDEPLRFRLRLIKNEDDAIGLGYTFQLLSLYNEVEGDVRGLLGYLLDYQNHDPDWDAPDEVTYKIFENDDGQQLAEPIRYWRVSEAIDCCDPFEARQTILVEGVNDELDHHTVQYWDYARNAVKPSGVSEEELLWVELNETTEVLYIFKGSEIPLEQVVLF